MKSVWIIDDHSAFRKTLARILKGIEPSLEVRQFASCEVALQAMLVEAAPQLLLLDIQLRGMSGIDGIPLFKDRNPQTSVVVLTVFEDDEKLFRAICAGANGYVLKTQSALEISSAVTTALDGGAPMTPRIARRVLDMFAQLAPEKNPDDGLSALEIEV
jgi:DNA-binding NarL/FixJ family response regulator